MANGFACPYSSPHIYLCESPHGLEYNQYTTNLLIRGFIDVCPNGALDKEGIMELYAMPRKEAQVFIDQMFLMFDRDGNGTISFKVRLKLSPCANLADCRSLFLQQT